MKLLEGKKGLIMGVLNDRSIAWGIAKTCHEHGAELAFTYVGEAGAKRLVPLAESLGADTVLECDVTSDEQIAKVFAELEKKWGKLDFLVHSIGYSDKNELKGRCVDTSRDNFKMTMDISCYSLIAVTKAAEPLMKKAGGGSIITMSYYGAEKVIPHYNVMGIAKAALEASVKYLAVDLGKHNIRVNAISSGPVKTLASSAIGGFNYILKWNEYNSPLRRNVTIEENGGTALYLLSDLSSGTTGEILHVDCGYNVIGMKDPEAPDLTLPKSE